MTPIKLWSRLNSWRVSRRVLNPDLDILNYEIAFRFNGNWKGGTYFFRVKVRARKNDVSLLKKKHRWSGTGACRLIADKGIKTIDGPDQCHAGIWSQYSLSFDTKLRKGQEHEVVFHIEADDPAEKARPVLSKIIDEYFEGPLTLKVVVPLDRQITAVGQVLPHIRSEEVIRPEVQLPIDEFTGEIKWMPSPVEMFRVYRILWQGRTSKRKSRH